MTLYPKLIMDALATVTYAGTKKNLVESEMVADQPAINGNKVTVEKQLAGVLDGYYTYFVGGELVSQYNPETQQDEYFYSPIEQMTFDYDAEKNSLTSNDCLLVAAGENLLAEGYMTVAFNPYEDVAMKPATPIVGEDYLPYNTENGSCFVTVYVPTEDVDGNYIDASKLTYSVYIDGELFTFNPEFYFYFEEPITQIEYGFIDDYRFQDLGGGRVAIEINKESPYYEELRQLTADITARTMQAQADINIKNLQDTQRINAENLEDTLRHQREEAARAQRLQTESNFTGAFTTSVLAPFLSFFFFAASMVLKEAPTTRASAMIRVFFIVLLLHCNKFNLEDQGRERRNLT